MVGSMTLTHPLPIKTVEIFNARDDIYQRDSIPQMLIELPQGGLSGWSACHVKGNEMDLV